MRSDLQTTRTRATRTRDRYLADFETFAAHRALAGEPAWLLGARRDALALFAERGFPTTRDEEWKYTSLAAVAGTPYRLAEPAELSARELAAAGVDLWDGPQLVFVNGHFQPAPSRAGTLPLGLRILPLSAALASPDDALAALLARELARPALEPHGLTALATAFMTDGAVIVLGARAVAPRPIHLVYVSVPAGEPALSAVRTVIAAGEISQAHVVETHLSVGPAKPGTFCLASTHATLDGGAVLSHDRVQREGEQAVHFSSTQVRLERDASWTGGTFTLGGALVRNDAGAVLAGEGARCRLAGLYLATGRQQVDTRTVVDHAMPHGTSQERYKGIVGDAAHGTFSGKVIVRPGARRTDARQSNDNLQLSRAAVVNTRPQLEIDNNDVQCAHGATIGQLDADALFYLRSRGLDVAEARALLTYAFASDMVEGVTVPAVRAALSEYLLGWLPDATNRGISA